MGRDALRPIKEEIGRFLAELPAIIDVCKDYFPEKPKSDMESLLEKSPDEMCRPALILLEAIFKELNTLRNKVEGMLMYEEISLPNGSRDRKRDDVWYNILVACGYNESEIYNQMGRERFVHSKIYNALKHSYISDSLKMMYELSSLRRIFDNKWLFYVDEKKGYYPVLNPGCNVEFQRITKGSPRFVVKNSPELYVKKEKETSLTELKAECKRLGIKGYSNKDKAELCELLKNHPLQGAS
jgi:hypothetical protein